MSIQRYEDWGREPERASTGLWLKRDDAAQILSMLEGPAKNECEFLKANCEDEDGYPNGDNLCLPCMARYILREFGLKHSEILALSRRFPCAQ